MEKGWHQGERDWLILYFCRVARTVSIAGTGWALRQTPWRLRRAGAVSNGSGPWLLVHHQKNSGHSCRWLPIPKSEWKLVDPASIVQANTEIPGPYPEDNVVRLGRKWFCVASVGWWYATRKQLQSGWPAAQCRVLPETYYLLRVVKRAAGRREFSTK